MGRLVSVGCCALGRRGVGGAGYLDSPGMRGENLVTCEQACTRAGGLKT